MQKSVPEGYGLREYCHTGKKGSAKLIPSGPDRGSIAIPERRDQQRTSLRALIEGVLPYRKEGISEKLRMPPAMMPLGSDQTYPTITIYELFGPQNMFLLV